MIRVKRVYEPPEKHDGCRILVDRVWPRGLTKEKAAVDMWLKDIAPSNELRKWFHHDIERCRDFKLRYYKELKDKLKYINEITDMAKKRDVTLLYAAKEERCNNATALRDYLRDVSVI